MRSRSVQPLVDETIAAMHRVRLYRRPDGMPIVVAEPRAENRSIALSARHLWDRYLRDTRHTASGGQREHREQSVQWFEVLDARRPGDHRGPLVVRIRIAITATGVLHLEHWSRTAWTVVEAAVGGRVPLERAHGRLPTITLAAEMPRATQTPAPAVATGAQLRPDPGRTISRNERTALAALRRLAPTLRRLQHPDDTTTAAT